MRVYSSIKTILIKPKYYYRNTKQNKNYQKNKNNKQKENRALKMTYQNIYAIKIIKIVDIFLYLLFKFRNNPKM